MKVNTARLLLSRLRGGDYAHAGDKEAIDLVIQKVLHMAPDLKKGNGIDIGCGFGGTANDFYQSGFNRIWGIDNDQSAISYAQTHYPHLTFICADAQKISDYFESDFFSFIYLFNVIYAIEDKTSLLRNLSTVSKPGAILVLFDYTSEGNQLAIKDFAGKPMFPMNLQNLKEDLDAAGWEIAEISDLTGQFIGWYKSLLVKLADNREKLSAEFSKEDILRVQNTFTFLLDYLKTGKLGGALVIAQKNS